MRRWYEPKKDTPGIDKNAPKKKGLALFLETWWREFFPLIKLNLLFLLSCIPIVTIPAAITAANRITTAMIRDRNYFMWTDYWTAFKRDLGRSLLAGLLLGVCLGLFGLSTWFYFMLSQTFSKAFLILAGCSLCLLLTAFFTSIYFFPMLAMVDLPVLTLLKNAMILSFTCFKRTLPGALIPLVLGGVTVGLFPFSMIYLVFLAPAMGSFISNFFVVKPIETVVLGIEEEPVPVQEQPEQITAAEEFPEWEDAKGEE